MVSRYLKEASMEQRLSGKASDSPTYKGKERRKRDPLYTTKKSLEADRKKAEARRKAAEKKSQNDSTEYEGPSLSEQAAYIDWFLENTVVEDLDPAKYRRQPGESAKDYTARIAQYHQDTTPANSGDKGAPEGETISQRNDRRSIEKSKKKGRKDELSETAQRDRSKDRKPWDRPTPTTKKTGSVFDDPKFPKPAPTTKKEGPKPPKQWDRPTKGKGSLGEQADYIARFLEEGMQAGGYESGRTRRGDASRPETPAGKRHQRRMEDRNKPENVAARKKIADMVADAKKKKKKKKPQKDWTEYEGPSLSEEAEYIARFLDEGKRWEKVKGAAKKIFKRKIKDARTPDQIERDQARDAAFAKDPTGKAWKEHGMSKLGADAKTARSHQIRGKQRGGHNK